MKTVKISELKDRLSHYLQLVRKGEPVLILDRDRVIARIDPAGESARPSADEEWIGRLERRGSVRRGIGKLPPDFFADRPRVKADLVRAVLDEREEGW